MKSTYSYCYHSILGLLFCAFFSSQAIAATITVNAQINQSGCDLIEAIQSANQDFAVGGCVAGDEADEIIISGIHTLTMPFDNAGAPPPYGDAGLPTITTPIIISSSNSSSEIRREVNDPSNRFRIFNVIGSNASLTLNNIVVSGGDVEFDISGNDNATRGGGIYLFASELSLNQSTITNNAAVSFGGGIYSSSSKIIISDSLITNNLANIISAMSLNSDSEVVIANSTIENNRTRRGSGNVVSALLTEKLKIINSSIVNNASGGVNVQGGNLIMLDTTISGNIKDTSMLNSILESISGLQISGFSGANSRHSIVNSTITDNPPAGTLAPDFIDIHGIRVIPPNTTSSDTLVVLVRNTIVSGNGASGSNGTPEGHEIHVYDDGANFIADDIFFEFNNNIIGHAGISQSLALNNVTISSLDNQILTSDSVNPTELRDIINQLGNYGGPSPSHTLPADSPAIDNGLFDGEPVLVLGEGVYWEPGCRGEDFAPGTSPPYRNDQRGLSRPIGTNCDVGSTEFRDSDIISNCYVVKAVNNNIVTFCL